MGENTANWMASRLKIAIGTMVVIFVCIAGLSYVFIHQVSNALRTEIERHGVILASSIEKTAANAILQDKTGALLHVLAADLRKNQGIAYVHISSVDGATEAKLGAVPDSVSNSKKRSHFSIGADQFVVYSEAVTPLGEEVLDIKYPIIFNGTQVGQARIGYSTRNINQTMSRLMSTSVSVAFLGLLLIAVAVLTLISKAGSGLYKDSITHKVTGLTIQTYFQERLDEEIVRSSRHGNTFCVIMTDLDNLKKINDKLGHSQGTFVLRELASLMRRLSRLDTVISIYGGDEFSILLPSASLEHGDIYVKRILEGVRSFDWTTKRGTSTVSVSIGIACFPDDSTTAQGLVECADEALYWAKNHGKDQAIHYHQLAALKGKNSNSDPTNNDVPDPESNEILIKTEKT